MLLFYTHARTNATKDGECTTAIVMRLWMLLEQHRTLATRRGASRHGAGGAREPSRRREHWTELLFVLFGEHGNLPRELAVCFLHRGEFGFRIRGGEFGFLRAAIDGGERGGGALAQSRLERAELCLERAELL